MRIFCGRRRGAVFFFFPPLKVGSKPRFLLYLLFNLLFYLIYFLSSRVYFSFFFLDNIFFKGSKGSRTNFENQRKVKTLLLTLPKYLSRSSTKRWMTSSVISSLSCSSIAQQKYRLAYLHEITHHHTEENKNYMLHHELYSLT